MTSSLNNDMEEEITDNSSNSSSNRESRWWNDSYIIAQNGNYRINNGTSLEWNNDFKKSIIFIYE